MSGLYILMEMSNAVERWGEKCEAGGRSVLGGGGGGVRGFPGRSLSRVRVNIYLPNLLNGIIRFYYVGYERLDKNNYKYQNCVFFTRFYVV